MTGRRSDNWASFNTTPLHLVCSACWLLWVLSCSGLLGASGWFARFEDIDWTADLLLALLHHEAVIDKNIHYLRGCDDLPVADHSHNGIVIP